MQNEILQEESAQMWEALKKQEDSLKEQDDRIKKLKQRRTVRTVLNALLTAAFIIICTFSIYRRHDETIIYDKPVQTDDNQQKIDDSTPQKDDSQSKIDDLKTDEYGFKVKTSDGKEIHFDKNGKEIPYDSDGKPIVYNEKGNRIPFDDDGKLLVYDEQGNRIPISELWKYIIVGADGKAVFHLSEKSEQPQTTEQTTQASGAGHFTIYSVGDAFTAENGSSTFSCDVRNVDDSTHDIVMSLYITADELSAHGLSTNGIDGDRWCIAQTGLFEPGYHITSVQLQTLPDGSYLPAGTYNLTMSEKYYHHETGVLSSYEANIPVTLEVAN